MAKELLNAATEQGVDLRFEASVAGGIPIIDVLKTDLIGNHFDSIMESSTAPRTIF